MGDRVLMQCYSSKTNEFGSVVYGHWAGGEAKDIVMRLALRMKERGGDIAYSTARLVQEMIDCSGELGKKHSAGFGVWNAEKLLTKDDSHGDAGVVLIDVENDHKATYIGGYLD